MCRREEFVFPVERKSHLDCNLQYKFFGTKLCKTVRRASGTSLLHISPGLPLRKKVPNSTAELFITDTFEE